MKREPYLRVNQYNTFKSRQDIVQFRGIRFQEFPSSRYIKEQILHQEVTAYGTSYGLLSHNLTS